MTTEVATKVFMKEELKDYGYKVEQLDPQITQEALQALIAEKREKRCNKRVKCDIYIPQRWEDRLHSKLHQ
jgi:hypothetical protein